MKVTTERVPDSQVVLEIEVEPERVERSLDQAYKRLANRARIPGFRPGKAPRHLIERTYGQEVLMQEALDKLIPEVYKEAVAEQDIDPIDVPNVEVETLDPVKFKATVAVRPTVDLGDYKDNLKVAKSTQAVTDDEVDAEVEEWRKRMATWEPAERKLALGDLIQADVELTVDGRPLVKQEDAEFLFRHGQSTTLWRATLDAARRRAERVLPRATFSNDDAYLAALAARSGIDAGHLRTVFLAAHPPASEQFANAIATLNQLRNAL